MPVPDGLIMRERFFLCVTKTGVGRFPCTQALRAQAAEGPPWAKGVPNHEKRMLPKSAYPSVKHRLTMMGNTVVPSGPAGFSF